jgi:hypothetical protein
MRETFDRLPDRLIERRAFGRSRTVRIFLAVVPSQVAPRADDHGIEQPGFLEPPRSQLLQANAERKHRHERCHSDRDA